MELGDADWGEANWSYLQRAIARVQRSLKCLIASRPDAGANSCDLASAEEEPLSPSELSPPSTLEQLCDVFRLSNFERDVLLLCVGMEFVPGWGELCAAAQRDEQLNYPTFHLAMKALTEPQWSAIEPQRMLRQCQILELGPGNSLSQSLLRVDEAIVHALVGGEGVDERLNRFLIPEMISASNYPGTLAPSHADLAVQMSDIWIKTSQARQVLPYLQLWGEDPESQRSIAFEVCKDLGLQEMVLVASLLPIDRVQLDRIRCLCDREWRLHKRVLILSCGGMSSEPLERQRSIETLIDFLNSPVMVLASERRPPQMRSTVAFEVRCPKPMEQKLIWQKALGEKSEALNGHIDRLVSQFNLSSKRITQVCLRGLNTGDQPGGWDNRGASLETSLPNQLWTYCREQARPRLDDLAQRIDSLVSWDDLVLPEKELQVLKNVVVHVRQRAKVYESWGFGEKSLRGLGIAALFAGASGTGKTLAAEVLASQLQLDLYRIDLSSVVSKYIGETEKNLRRVFDAAEGGGAVLLFDEADALFGRRSEVKDSHDRHANIEVSYLLQRMEAYRGLAILTTNLKGALDQAFLRRIRFVVQFPFPDASQRAEIWRRVFPKQTPTVELDYKKLSRLTVSGGNIRNIALNAAFMAAEEEGTVEMKYILQAAQSEYVKLERPLTDMEIKGWV